MHLFNIIKWVRKVKKWTSLIRNKYFRYLLILVIVSIATGIFYYAKLKTSINFEEINLINVIKNNALIHMIIILIIFFTSFILVGSFVGVIAIIYEIVCLTVLGATLIVNLNLIGILILIVLIVFKSLYLFLLIYLTTRCFNIAKYILTNKSYLKDKISIYIKQSLCSSLIIIALEVFNFFLGYKIIGIFAI